MPVSTQRFLFFDIDYTLVKFSHEQGMMALHEYLASRPKPLDLAYRKKIEGFMDETFYTLLRGETTERSKELRALIEDATKKVLGPTYLETDLCWSRELWLSVACQQHNITVQSSKTILEAAGSYWDAIRQHGVIYPDAQKLFGGIEFSSWKVVLVTNSDARLTVTEDGQLVYDPKHSMRSKLKRLPAELLDYDNITRIIVGDPVGKPHASFWKQVIHETGYNPSQDIGVMVGDSYASDIVGVGEYGIRGVLLDRSQKINRLEVPEATDIITDLSVIPKLLKLLHGQRPNE